MCSRKKVPNISLYRSESGRKGSDQVGDPIMFQRAVCDNAFIDHLADLSWKGAKTEGIRFFHF
jgi:hypothetical protein